MVEYIEQVDITKNNLHVLKNKEKYFFLIDERITSISQWKF